MEKNRLLVEKAIKANCKTLRNMTAYICGYLEESNPEISDLLKIMSDESFMHDLEKENETMDRTIDTVLKTIKK